jgi:hypothetical protein
MQLFLLSNLMLLLAYGFAPVLSRAEPVLYIHLGA